MDYQQLVEDYIRKQEKFYKRNIKGLTKFLLRDFANSIQKNLNTSDVKIERAILKRPSKYIKSNSKINSKIRIALITEDVGHLTGGRYYCWFIACALQELGYKVTVYTNQAPVFGNYFKNYQQPEVRVVVDKARHLEHIDVEADIYIGSPISGNIAVTKLGKKYNKPSYALIFDPFPMMDKYLGKRTYVNWIPLISALRSSSTQIISLCDSTSEYIYDWLNKRKHNVYPIYPCINSREFKEGELKKEDYVVFISRLVKHKNFDHVLKACKNLGLNLKVISSVDGINAQRLVKDMGMKKQVEFCMNVNDEQKWEIIKKARVVINGSKFEGFGMWFIEAITCGTPTVCYDYPTIREITEKHNVKNVYMAKWNNPDSLQEQLEKAYREEYYTEQSKDFYFESMLKRVNEVFVQEPKIGVVTICLNEEKFIQASLKSVIRHPNIKKVAVVEGAVNLFPRVNEKGLSVDNTNEQIRQVLSTDENAYKIIYDQYGFANDKSELRNRALSLLDKDITHILIVDADEVYKQEDLDNLVQAMKENPKTGVFLYPFYHFWKKKDLIAKGGQWESQMFRCFRFANKKLKWARHELPVVDEDNKFINQIEGVKELDNVHVYHYGYMKDKKDVQAKLEYYKKRDGHILRVTDTWTNWKEGEPTQPTHGGGTVEKFKGKHPEEIENIL